MPSPLNFSLNPSSSAASTSGLDYAGGMAGGYTGAISVGGADSWITGLVRDFALGVAVALAAKWAWGRMK